MKILAFVILYSLIARGQDTSKTSLARSLMSCYRATQGFPGQFSKVGNLEVTQTGAVTFGSFPIYDDSIPGFYVLTDVGLRKYQTGKQNWKDEGSLLRSVAIGTRYDVDKMKLHVPINGLPQDLFIDQHKVSSKKPTIFRTSISAPTLDTSGRRDGGLGGEAELSPEILDRFKEAVRSDWTKFPDFYKKFYSNPMFGPQASRQIARTFLENCGGSASLGMENEYNDVRKALLTIDKTILSERMERQPPASGRQ